MCGNLIEYGMRCGFSLKLSQRRNSSDNLKTEKEPASVAQLDAASCWIPGGHGFNLRRDRQHSFMEIDHEKEPASVAQLDAPSCWIPGGHGFNLRRDRQHSFMEIDHEIFSLVILSLLLIQEGQLSVSGERMCIILVNRLED